MQEIIKLLLGIAFLISGIPLGKLLRTLAKDEIAEGKIYFKMIIFLGISLGLIGLILNKDWMLFTFFFISIVTYQSID